MKKKETNKNSKKKLIAILFCLLVSISLTIAEGEDFGLGERINLILQFIASPWVKGIACLALIVECIGLFTAGRQEPGMFKKFIPWIAGTVIFMAAGTITGKFIDISNNTFVDQLKID